MSDFITVKEYSRTNKNPKYTWEFILTRMTFKLAREGGIGPGWDAKNLKNMNFPSFSTVEMLVCVCHHYHPGTRGRPQPNSMFLAYNLKSISVSFYFPAIS